MVLGAQHMRALGAAMPARRDAPCRYARSAAARSIATPLLRPQAAQHRRTPILAVAAAAAASSAGPAQQPAQASQPIDGFAQIQRVCKTMLLATAAAAAWSVMASTIAGGSTSSSAFASVSFAVGGSQTHGELVCCGLPSAACGFLPALAVKGRGADDAAAAAAARTLLLRALAHQKLPAPPLLEQARTSRPRARGPASPPASCTRCAAPTTWRCVCLLCCCWLRCAF